MELATLFLSRSLKPLPLCLSSARNKPSAPPGIALLGPRVDADRSELAGVLLSSMSKRRREAFGPLKSTEDRLAEGMHEGCWAEGRTSCLLGRGYRSLGTGHRCCEMPCQWP